MRRIGAAIALLGLLACGLVAGAHADDSHTYQVEMLNAFGIQHGSEVRIAGVRTGTVTEIDVNEAKRAVATIELSGPTAVLGERTTCSTEPQSLIAEYFIDCNPLGEPLPEGGLIPADQVNQSIQIDLVANTLRQPFRERLRLIINELGTALAANGDNLNDAIRLSVPALTELHQTTSILARQRRAIGDLTTDSERIIARLADRREDVVAATAATRDAAAVAASRRDDLSRDTDLLDDFMAELRPTLAELGDLARAGSPVLAGLRSAAPSLNALATSLPDFSAAGADALAALGAASPPGTAALLAGRDEIRDLRRSGRDAAPVAEILADLLRDLDDPSRAVEEDQRAARHCDDPSLPCYATGRAAPTGYSGFEALLNYVYYQTLAVNQFDSIGHLLQFNVYEAGAGPCGGFNARPNVPASGGGRTTDILEADPCVTWLGPTQPDINRDLGLPRYDDSSCPDGSTHPKICDPTISTHGPGNPFTTGETPGATPPAAGTTPAPPPAASEPQPTETPQSGGDAPLDLPEIPGLPGLEDLLDLPGLHGLGDRLPGPAPNGLSGRGRGRAVRGLLDFLFAH